MSVRVQVILDESERDELKRLAREEGLSLSAWLRDAGRAKAEAAKARPRFTSASDLERYFAACDDRESGEEPSWDEHLAVIDRSRSEGAGEPT